MKLKRFALASVAACLLLSSLAWGGVPTFPGTSGGGGAVSSVTAGSGCVTVSPTTGAVIVTSTGCLANSGGSVALTNIAAIADQRILGNVSGGSASPIALTAAQVNTMLGTTAYTFSTGLTNTSGTVTNNLSTGINAATQTIIGGTLTTQGLTVQPNAADTTTGRTTFQGLGISLPVGTAAAPSLNFGSSNAGIYATSAGAVMQFSFGGVDAYDIRAAGMTLLNNSAGTGYFLGTAGQAGITINGTTGVNIFAGNAIKASFTAAGNFLFGGSVATTATDGDLYIPSCAGPPTGVPSQAGNTIPLRADRTNSKVYAYMGATWVALN